jgi:hypothetical protein
MIYSDINPGVLSLILDIMRQERLTEEIFLVAHQESALGTS